MSTQIRIGLEVKGRLEEYRDNEFKVKTHSDAIDTALDRYNAQRNQINDLKSTIEDMKIHAGREDITLGYELKEKLLETMKELGLSSPAAVVDLLLFNWSLSLQVDRSTFDYYVTLKNKR